jgi:hypothetical protein
LWVHASQFLFHHPRSKEMPVNPIVKPQQQEIWLSDDNEGLRHWAQKLLLNYGEVLGNLDLSKILFFRVIGNRDMKKKGCTWRLMPPYTHLIRGSSQLLTYAFEGFGEAAVEHEKTVKFANEKVNPAFVIALFDDHHSDDADRLYTLLHELYHVDPSMVKMRDHTIKDHYWMVEKMGLGSNRDLSELQSLL